MTAVAPIDHDSVASFWERAVAAGAVTPGTEQPSMVEVFGDSQELADELLGLVIHGPKRATAGAAVDYERSGDPLPYVGQLWIAADGHGRVRALLRTTDVRVGALSSVDERFAWDEGEDDRTRAKWLEEHERYFRRYLPTIGVEFTDDMATVFERFELLYSE